MNLYILKLFIILIMSFLYILQFMITLLLAFFHLFL
jgi:hypothetical protein